MLNLFIVKFEFFLIFYLTNFFKKLFPKFCIDNDVTFMIKILFNIYSCYIYFIISYFNRFMIYFINKFKF